jgi:hypothetical protein
MKVSELRLRNLVFDNLGGILKIIGIKEESDLSHLRPIPLTEEWLLKFGFKVNRQTKEENNIWRCYWTEGHFEIEQIIGFFLWDNNCYGTKIKYVHQLQNLYFALTGEELIIKQD